MLKVESQGGYKIIHFRNSSFKYPSGANIFRITRFL